LKAFTNYTVALSPRMVQSVRGNVLEKEFKYWFHTGAPRGSQVRNFGVEEFDYD
jgi:hypothetical protein